MLKTWFQRMTFWARTFWLALLVYLVATLLLGSAWLALASSIALLVSLAVYSYRAFRSLARKVLWSVGRRLLVSYMLAAVVPMGLVLALLGLSLWIFMGQLSVFLVGQEIDQKLDQLQIIAEAITRIEKNEPSASDAAAIETLFPGICGIVSSDNERLQFPPDDPECSQMELPASLRGTGILTDGLNHYLFARASLKTRVASLLVPVDQFYLSNLIPGLGIVEIAGPPPGHRRSGLEQSSETRPPKTITSPKEPPPASRRLRFIGRVVSKQIRTQSQLPALNPLGFWDVLVVGMAPLSVTRLVGSEAVPARRLLLVQTRPSALLATIYSRRAEISNLLIAALGGIATLFLIVELISITTGVSLAGRVARVVNQLYLGTRQLKAGKLDYRVTVKGDDQLAELATSFNEMADGLQRLIALEGIQRRLEAELEIARQVQQQLFPPITPKLQSSQIDAVCLPARKVSGDFYDFVQLSESELFFAIGDVAGKGISAALLMAAVVSSLRTLLAAGVGRLDYGIPSWLSTIVFRLNSQLYQQTAPEKFVTLFAAYYNDVTGDLCYVNAGHPGPCLRQGSGILRRLESTAPVLGVFPDIRFQAETLQLQSSDLLLAFTDGLTEAESPAGEEFGEARLVQLLQNLQGQQPAFLIKTVIENLQEWNGSSELMDDVTLLCLYRQPAPVASSSESSGVEYSYSSSR